MNPDLHMADGLKNTGKRNLLVVFGEPDLGVQDAGDGMVTVQVVGLDVFDPQTGDISSGGTENIAAWFIDTLYDEESFASAMPISSAPTTPTNHSRPHCARKSTRKPGPRSTATPRAPSRGRKRAGSRSR
jgi:hypothetical protein